ncbi:MAG: FtsX-like permease family protein, partial [Gemmatimonadota bacterium]
RPWAAVNSATFRTAGFILLGSVVLVLLLVCANVANLLLARSALRRREMAVRTAMGAGRGRLLRQLLSEAGVLALLGGGAGLALALVGVRGIRTFLDTLGISFISGRIEVDGTVVAYTVLVTLLAGLVFGLVPAFQSAGADVRGDLRNEGRGSTGGRTRLGFRKAFVGLEVALALGLLGAGGLLGNSLLRLSMVDPGVDADEILTMRLTRPFSEYDEEGIRVFFQELTERTRAVPGVIAATAATQIPPLGFSRQQIEIEGSPPDAERSLPTALATVVLPGYFETVGTPLLAGRALRDEDEAGAPPAVVLNEAAARRFFPDGEPLGRHLRLSGREGAPWFTVVGVAADARNRGLDVEPEPELFAAQAQAGGGNQLFLLLRTSVEPRTVLPAVRRAVAEMDADQPIYAIQTLKEAFRAQGSPRQATTLFLGLFAAFALLLAAVGVYGVVAYAVGERTREIGVRVALGAAPGQVRWMVVAQALTPVVVGVLVGVALATAIGRAMSGMLYGVGGTDPATLATAAAVLLAVASVASWIPARRATRLDPSAALRIE